MISVATRYDPLITRGDTGILPHVISYLALGIVSFACQYEWSVGSKIDRLNVLLFLGYLRSILAQYNILGLFLQRYHSFTMF